MDRRFLATIVLSPMVFTIAVFVSWEIACKALKIPITFLPAPTDVWGALVKYWDPKGVRSGDARLRYYADHFDTVEVNSTYYRLPEEAMETEFVARAADEGMVELAGHRSVGGIRASIYNAVPLEAVRTLRSFMERLRAATP